MILLFLPTKNVCHFILLFHWLEKSFILSEIFRVFRGWFRPLLKVVLPAFFSAHVFRAQVYRVQRPLSTDKICRVTKHPRMAYECKENAQWNPGHDHQIIGGCRENRRHHTEISVVVAVAELALCYLL